MVIIPFPLFLSWVLIYEKGYQDTEDLVSTAVTKTKGIMIERWDPKTNVAVLLDAADIVNPPLENNAFFVATHIIITPHQTPSRCPGV